MRCGFATVTHELIRICVVRTHNMTKYHVDTLLKYTLLKLRLITTCSRGTRVNERRFVSSVEDYRCLLQSERTIKDIIIIPGTDRDGCE